MGPSFLCQLVWCGIKTRMVLNMESINSSNVTIADLSSTDLEAIGLEIKAWGSWRVVHLVTFILSQTIGSALLSGIVWYEELGGMDQYKTVLNQIMAHISMVMVLGIITVF